MHSLFLVDTLPDTKVRQSYLIMNTSVLPSAFLFLFVMLSEVRMRWLRCAANLYLSLLLKELTSHMKPKGQTMQPMQTQPSSMRRADTTTRTRRRSTLSKLDRPGETGGDAGGGGAVGALCLTLIGSAKAWWRRGRDLKRKKRKWKVGLARPSGKKKRC